MGALDPISSVTPTPNFKSFSLTHIVYDPSHPLSIPLTLLSLSPIFLFVSYFTLVIFNRQLTILLLAVGQLGNEAVNLILKRLYKAERPFPGYGEVGRGYGMPSSHAQASGFLVAWGVSYVITGKRRCIVSSPEKGILEAIRWWRTRVYVFGLLLWSWLVSYSRWHLLYHSPIQVIAGYTFGLITGATYFIVTEYIPLYHPASSFGRIRKFVEELWVGIGGVGGWSIAGVDGGWAEGPFLLGETVRKKAS